MRLLFKITVFNLLFGLFFFSGLRASSLDTLNQDGLHDLIDRYYELFGIANLEGEYYQANEARFLNLFVDDAGLFNFLPGNALSHRELTPEQYIELVKTAYSGKIIRPGKALSYQPKEMYYDISKGKYQYLVELEKSVVIFDKDSYEELEEFYVILLLDIVYHLDEQELKIESIRAPGTRHLDLSFRVLHQDRRIASNISVRFSYLAAPENPIERKRFTNHRGEVFLSNVPENASLQIFSGDGKLIDSGAQKTAGEWSALNQENRFLLLDAASFQSKIPERFQLEAGIHYPFQMLTSDISFPGDSLLNKNLMASLLPRPGFYLLISRIIVHYHNYTLSAGVGIDRLSMGFESLVPSKIFPSVNGQEQPAEDLSDNITGRITREEYGMTSVRFPLYLALGFRSSNRYFRGADFRVVARYSMPYDMKYKINFRQEVTADPLEKADGWDDMLHTNAPQMFQSGDISYLAGNVSEPGKWLLGVETIFNFRLYQDFLTFQYRISYSYNTLGVRDEPHFFRIESAGHQYQYHPFLSTNQFRFMNLSVGFGLAFSF